MAKFLRLVEEDMHRPRLEKNRVARKTLNAFIGYLQGEGFAPKSINTYVGAVQSLAKYYDIPLSMRYVGRPPAKAVYKKYPWTIEEIDKFASLMDNIQYKCIAACIVQSGLSISDLLSLKYSDIQSELEKGVSPLCLDLSRKKTNVPFLTFLGGWALSLLKQHLKGKDMQDDTPLFAVSARAVDSYFARVGRKFGGGFKGRNPYSPHSLRAAFRTILSDHKVKLHKTHNLAYLRFSLSLNFWIVFSNHSTNCKSSFLKLKAGLCNQFLALAC
ncbi:site-specific integrase [Candidatus Bathyarchaeota archaeon]|nr:site-specific integrase [Candidatus Bathyarchaeota archaeon]